MKEYGGYHFEPAGKLDKDRIEGLAGVILRNRTELKIWDESSNEFYGEEASTQYTHQEFYAAMGNPDDDFFICTENGKTYLPCEHELMQFMGYRVNRKPAITKKKKVLRKDVVEYIAEKDRNSYMVCTTCTHYQKAIVCDECYSGRRYCLDWRRYYKENEKEIDEWLA